MPTVLHGRKDSLAALCYAVGSTSGALTYIPFNEEWIRELISTNFCLLHDRKESPEIRLLILVLVLVDSSHLDYTMTGKVFLENFGTLPCLGMEGTLCNVGKSRGSVNRRCGVSEHKGLISHKGSDLCQIAKMQI